jgi:hypothetical protein
MRFQVRRLAGNKHKVILVRDRRCLIRLLPTLAEVIMQPTGIAAMSPVPRSVKIPLTLYQMAVRNTHMLAPGRVTCLILGMHTNEQAIAIDLPNVGNQLPNP